MNRVCRPARPRWRLSHAAVRSLVAIICLLPASGSGAKEASEAEGPPEPVDLTRETVDGVTIAMRYFAGNDDENTVPVLIIHDWKQAGADYEDFARYLQSKGYAVVVPDLRGHGSSTTKIGPDKKIQTITPQKVDKRQFFKDLEAVRTLLWEKNQEKKLNLKKLCLIGVGNGAVLATHYAMHDWDPAKGIKRDEHWKTLLRGGSKDVRALVLISPPMKFGPLSIKTPLNHPEVQSEISMLVVVGEKDKKAMKSAKYVHGLLQKYHQTDDERNTSLFLNKKETPLQGHKLLTEPELNTEALVNAFIKLRLVERKIAWKEHDRHEP